MKKISILLLIIFCMQLVSCTFVDSIFNGNLNLTAVCKCEDASIKFLDDSKSSNVIYQIMPSGMDFEALAKKGYRIRIEVSYDVYYKKDYNVLWDIGYMGSPKYEVAIYNSDKVGNYQNDLTTKITSQTRTITYESAARDCANTIIYLKFSTDNIQNIIYFTNINVSFTAYK